MASILPIFKMKCDNRINDLHGVNKVARKYALIA